MDEPTQQERYPSGLHSSSPAREGEIQRETNELRHSARELNKLTEELITALAPILSPRDEGSLKEQEARSEVTTPLATNLYEINYDLDKSKRAIKFILRGLEL